MRVDFVKPFSILPLFAAILPAFPLTVERDIVGEGESKLENNISATPLNGSLSDQTYTLTS